MWERNRSPNWWIWVWLMKSYYQISMFTSQTGTVPLDVKNISENKSVTEKWEWNIIFYVMCSTCLSKMMAEDISWDKWHNQVKEKNSEQWNSLQSTQSLWVNIINYILCNTTIYSYNTSLGLQAVESV
jgi:hypothetical protein